MTVFTDENALKGDIKSLPLTHAIAFAAFCCERLLPIYIAFSQIEGVGSPVVAQQSLDFVWNYVEDTTVSLNQGTSLHKELAVIEPKSDEYHSFFTFPAMLAIDGIQATLESCLYKDISKTAFSSSCVLSGLYHYVRVVNQQDLEGGSEDSFEQEMWLSPLMRWEMEKQKQGLSLLQSNPLLDNPFITTFRLSASKGGIDPFRRGLLLVR